MLCVSCVNLHSVNPTTVSWCASLVPEAIINFVIRSVRVVIIVLAALAFAEW